MHTHWRPPPLLGTLHFVSIFYSIWYPSTPLSSVWGLKRTRTHEKHTACYLYRVRRPYCDIGHGIHIDGSTTDSNLVNNWISDSGESAIFMHSAAGWQVSGNHLYGTCNHAIYANDCFATTIGGEFAALKI